MIKNIDSLAIVVFDGFETLDVMGPVEVFGRLSNCKIVFISQDGGKKTSRQGVTLQTQAVDLSLLDILLVPGG